MAKYTDIQNEVIKKYRVRISSGCPLSYRTRTHSHPKLRQVCKWKQANSVQSTFTLFHEIGHIETDQAWMRRAEQEFYATRWAIIECKQWGIEVPESIIKKYQDYIDRTKGRGLRRGGEDYGTLKLI